MEIRDLSEKYLQWIWNYINFPENEAKCQIVNDVYFNYAEINKFKTAKNTQFC